MLTDIFNPIKESFELWYNRNIAKDSPVSIVINYRDTQTLRIKAYHTVCVEMQALGIKDGKSYTIPIRVLQENYNHGVTSEEEAKEGMAKKLLMELYGYRE